jgi:hypothetical protein
LRNGKVPGPISRRVCHEPVEWWRLVRRVQHRPTASLPPSPSRSALTAHSVLTGDSNIVPLLID